VHLVSVTNTWKTKEKQALINDTIELVVVLVFKGQVILFGNNKSIEDSMSPLAQRFFDHTSIVRLTVINVIGQWMLQLRDRYSYFHLMLPLLLTGYTDEIEEIRTTTDSLWWDIGRIVNNNVAKAMNLFVYLFISRLEI
jgi:hypothetical protein